MCWTAHILAMQLSTIAVAFFEIPHARAHHQHICQHTCARTPQTHTHALTQRRWYRQFKRSLYTCLKRSKKQWCKTTPNQKLDILEWHFLEVWREYPQRGVLLVCVLRVVRVCLFALCVVCSLCVLRVRLHLCTCDAGMC